MLMQEMLGDALDGVAGMGLECISLLCEADVLDFYSAWPVVVAHFPDLPHNRPILATRFTPPPLSSSIFHRSGIGAGCRSRMGPSTRVALLSHSDAPFFLL